MLRRLTRVAFIVMLAFGVASMHTIGHGEHTGHGHLHAVGHGMASPAEASDVASEDLCSCATPAADEAATLLGILICAAILMRSALELLRSAWFRLRQRMLLLLAPPPRSPLPAWPLPVRLRPTGIQLNRVAVLRI